METIVLVITAVFTILWSVRSFFFASEQLGMSEESSFKIVTIAAPSVYFLALVFTGLSDGSGVRLDLIGMVAIDLFAVVSLVVSFVIQAVRPDKQRRLGIALFASYHAVSCLAIVAVFAVRRSPELLVRAASLVDRVREIEFLSFAWVGLDTERQEQDLVAFFNRMLIAVISYLPIGVLRFVTSVRHRRRMQREIESLTRRVANLEREAHRSDI